MDCNCNVAEGLPHELLKYVTCYMLLLCHYVKWYKYVLYIYVYIYISLSIYKYIYIFVNREPGHRYYTIASETWRVFQPTKTPHEFLPTCPVASSWEFPASFSPKENVVFLNHGNLSYPLQSPPPQEIRPY